MKKRLFLLFIIGAFALSCSDDSDEITVDEGQNEEENTVELPDGYIVIDSDTFYISGVSKLSDPNYNRLQLNLSSKEQLTTNSNDGSTASTIGLVVTTTQPLTESGSLSFTDSRFPDSNDKVNFYMSFFFNTGHANEGKNYLSPADGAFTFTITSDSFKAGIMDLTMTNEAENTDTFKTSGNIEY